MFYLSNEPSILCLTVLLNVKSLFSRYIFVKYVCAFVMNKHTHSFIFFCDKHCFLNHSCSKFLMPNVNWWFMFIFISIFSLLVSLSELVYVLLHVLVKTNRYMFVLVWISVDVENRGLTFFLICHTAHAHQQHIVKWKWHYESLKTRIKNFIFFVLIT